MPTTPNLIPRTLAIAHALVGLAIAALTLLAFVWPMARASYSFSPRVFVQSLMQYNQQTRFLSGNFRFGWLQSANAGIFVVYNEGRERDVLDGGRRDDSALGLIRDRSLVIKFSRLIDIFN